jgi:chromosome segregation protein
VEKRQLLLKEVILENFMSYEYARIPLKSGLNLICGPNGSGKSAILLAISVALGQTYTERSRKLSGLIRWGKDLGRVTLVFDNTKINGKRPCTRYDSDALRISRVLRKDGTYWFEINYHTVTKAEIIALLTEQGINPNNMLLIMHQNMMHQFGVTTPSEKLKLMEDAVGLGEYRQEVIEAQNKLTQLLSEEDSVTTLLDNAEETLEHWKTEYDRYLRRKELLRRKQELEREYAWANVAKMENEVESWMEKLETSKEHLKKLHSEVENTTLNVGDTDSELKDLRYDKSKLYHSLIEKERRMEREQAIESESGRHLNKIVELKNRLLDFLKEYPLILSEESQKSVSTLIQELTETLEEEESLLTHKLEQAKKLVSEAENEIKSTRGMLNEIDRKIEENMEGHIKNRVKLAVLQYRVKELQSELSYTERKLSSTNKELDEYLLLAEEHEPRLKTDRTPLEISDEIKVVNAHLGSLGEVSEEVETMYSHYSSIYDELKEKAVVLAENRKKTFDEVEERKIVWENLINSLLTEVIPTYQQLLSKMDATGDVRLIDAEDIEEAGLELTVGFKGAEPAVLNNMTQSGGERSVSVMAFLIALQQHVISSFRAVDEFDVHMDPRNREVMSNILLTEIKGSESAQYISITPGQIVEVDESVHVITVQNVKGRSEVNLLVKD